MWGNNNLGIQSDDPGQLQVILDSSDSGVGYINDYRATLQLCYREYLQRLSSWLHRRLGLGLSAQVSYNMPMDMAFNVPYVDVPECESLGFGQSVDAYRQFAGAAALGGRGVVSNELGADFLLAYQQSIPWMLEQTKIGFSSGINRYVLHGANFAGNYSGTTWPGHTPFRYLVSEMNSRHQPSWHTGGFLEAMDYLARTQYTQQAGTDRVDIAILNHVSATNPNLPLLYSSNDLQAAGKSLQHLGDGVSN